MNERARGASLVGDIVEVACGIAQTVLYNIISRKIRILIAADSFSENLPKAEGFFSSKNLTNPAFSCSADTNL